MENSTKEQIEQLQLLEQSMQNFLNQKQQFQSQLIEIESALKEIENASQSYKIVGNMMFLKDNKELKHELIQKKETVELRIKTLEDQENKTKEKASKMQESVMKELNKEKKED